MTVATNVPDAPPMKLRYRRYLQPIQAARELIARRELVVTLAERELRARYKQATLGFAWSIITPIALMVVFTVFFKRVTRVETNGIPYPLFSYIGLLPWTFFSSAVSTGGTSLITNTPIMNKVACPREVFPLSNVIVAGVDTLLAMIALVVLFVINGFTPHATVYWVPLIALVQILFTVGVVLIVSSIMVYVRDLKHALPLVIQIGLFATPVAYGMEAIPVAIRRSYGYINPLAPVIDSYRRTILLGRAPDWRAFIPAVITATVIAVVGYMFFKRLETGFADVA